MQKRRLGRSDLYLTPLGLGTWAIGGPWAFGWGPQDDAESVATIGRALDLGVGWIDTAPAYGLGHAESLVGRTIRGRRDEVVIATKCGLVWDEPAQGRVTNRLTAASIEKEADDSLKRLGIEAIDLYQIHRPNPDAGLEEAWDAMARLVERGKVRHAGVSNFGVGQLQRAQALHPVTSLQPPYSLLDRGFETELLPYCAAHGIGVVAYGPLAYGLLTGKYTRARLADLPADDWRRRGARFQEPELSANLAFVEGFRRIADGEGCSLAGLAIAWVLRRPEIASAIVGARSPAQIAETVKNFDQALSAEVLGEIERLLGEREGLCRERRPVEGA
jgi:aryl-alcohol dehydrogenase-like predicted oxidoreductase